jgi:hypothetical protein
MKSNDTKSSYMSAPVQDAIITNTDIALSEKNSNEVQEEYIKHIRNKIDRLAKDKTVDAIDELSTLLIDISASIANNHLAYYCDESEECNTFSLLDKLKTSDLVKINQGLSGWKKNNEVLAPCYKPSLAEFNAIYNFIHSSKPVSKAVIKSIIKNKAIASNFQSFVINGSVEAINSKKFYQETILFFEELKTGIETIDRVFEQTGLTGIERKLFHIFVSWTASTLFYLGFADSINHSVQVARKCAIDAYRKNLSRPDILQAAIVGWIHDPKLPGSYSWSNLSTHPIIASAIALEVLTRPDLHYKIDLYLDEYGKDAEHYVKGIVEAVAINNDSKFVLDNAIFNRPTWAPGLPESGGVIDQISCMNIGELKKMGIKFDSQDLVKEIIDIALDRFYAPSNMKKPASFNIDIIKLLKNIQVDTGIIGIDADSFYFHFLNIAGIKEFEISESIPELFEQILSGEYHQTQIIKELSESLKKSQKEESSAFYILKVSADKLFSHHDEMKFAPIAASNLAIADRLLLSPHKILEAGVQNTVLGRIISFMDSFEDNIKSLPKSAQAGGRIFQRDLYVSILQAADILTDQDNFDKFHKLSSAKLEKHQPFCCYASKEISLKNIVHQVEYLKYLIQEKSSWINCKTGTDFSNINPTNTETNPDFLLVTKTIQKTYDIAIETSPEMFGYTHLKKFNKVKYMLTKLFNRL